MELAEKLLSEAAAALAANDLPGAQRAIRAALMEPVDWPLRGHVIHGAAFVYRRAGLIHESLRYWEEFLQGAAERGGISERKLAESNYNFGLTLRQARRYGEAVVAYAKAATGFEALGDRAGRCAALTNLAWAACHSGQLDVARDALDVVDGLTETEDDRHHFDLSSALLLHRTGFDGQAVDMCRRLLDDGDAASEVKADAAYILGLIYAAGGKPAEAGHMAEVVGAHGTDSRHAANVAVLAERARQAN
jgi:tetratricopeptide (TPR) repeat protein